MCNKLKFSTYFDKESYIRDLGTTNDMESLTDQSFKSNADINELVLMYQNGMAPRTGTPVTFDISAYKLVRFPSSPIEFLGARLPTATTSATL